VEPWPRDISEPADLLLVNPLAGNGRAIAALPALRNFAAQRGWNLEIDITKSAEDLTRKARLAAQSGRERILVLGGDGTFQLLLNAVRDQPQIVLGVIPAGGGNDLAAALGLPADPLQAAALVLNGEPRYLDAVRARTADGIERLFSGGGGVGLDAEAARHANGSYRRLGGRARYRLSAIRALLCFRAFRARIILYESAGDALQATALVVGVLNTPSYGGGLYLAPKARTDDGQLELVIVEDLNALQILRLLPAFALRGELNTQRIRRLGVKQVRIETETPLWVHGDGEVLGMTPAEFSVVPRAVRILCPARKVNS
jgi:diacylglycerol kinase (ATP)